MNRNVMSSGQARSIKLSGDRIRKLFEKQCVNQKSEVKQEHLVGLSNQYADGTYTLKSGSNWQFHLGSFYPYIDKWGTRYIEQENLIKHSLSNDKIIFDLRSEDFIRSFLLKGNFFCIYDAPNWLIFDSQDFIEMMQDREQVMWRILESGRIKGDVYTATKKRTIFTLEYRAEHHKKQFVFGAHGGGAGDRLKNILKHKLFFNSIPVDYELWK